MNFIQSMTKLIILGINRSGTKLASLIAAKAFDFRYVFLEPFRWESGIDTRIGSDWQPQLARRAPAKTGIKEHRRLPIFPDEKNSSPWLENILTKQGWDLVKFIQIGRANLYHKICPITPVLAVIREPVAQFTSLNGATVPKEDVANQWLRIKKETGCSDPLPDAENFLPKDLADCARAYFILYNYLSKNLPENSVRVAFENLKTQTGWLEKIGAKINCRTNKNISVPKIGISTKNPLTENQQKYIKEKLSPVYNNFLTKS